MNDILREFLLETNENLAQLDLDLVVLERDPQESETLARVFRTLHTVKGTAGFLGLVKLQALGHAGESLLSKLRTREIVFNSEIATALLGVVDGIRAILASIELTEKEGDGDYTALIQSLEHLTRKSGDGDNLSRATQSIVAQPPDAKQNSRFESTVPLPPAGSNKSNSSSHAPIILPQPVKPIEPVISKSSPAPARSEPLAETLVSQVPNLSQRLNGPLSAGPNLTAPEQPEARSLAVADTSVRVDIGLLDKLMTLVGELVLARNQVMQFSASQQDAGFMTTVQRLNLLTTELQAGVMKTRMQPIGAIWSKFPRVVRDLALACGKQVRLELDGQETELDRTIVEAIRDPLTHMVRNAVDHGIEAPAERLARGKPAEGRLLLHASHEGGKVIIRIADDGGGIDPIRVKNKAVQASLVSPEQVANMSERELVNLVFLPGFSTAERITHFSGRGVGMDVVRTNIEKIGGSVDIESHVGRGTNVRLKIPLTLAIIPALTITTGGDRYAIPQVSLLELVRLEGKQAQKGVESIHGTPVYRLRGSLLPLVYLDRELQVEPADQRGEEMNIVVLQADDRPFGLIVDEIHDTEEIVVKPLQKQLKGIPVYAGATIMGDGKVALILDVLGLAQHAGVVSGERVRALTEQGLDDEPVGDRQPVLLIATAGGEQMAIPLSRVARLEEFPRTAVERVGGRRVVQYRGEILPLMHVSRALDEARNSIQPKRTRKNIGARNGSPKLEESKLQVVVAIAQGRQVGLIVSKILDIVEETIVTRDLASRPGVLFTAVVQERVTEFLDIEALMPTSMPPGKLAAPSTVKE